MGTAAAPSPSAKAKTILVVDDNALIRRNVCEELISSGFESCVEAENGAHALIEAEKVKPDLIILDLSMPVMNGLEAAPVLHRMLPETPIILYTLYGSSVSKEKVSVFGISDVVSKDEPLESLIATAYSLLLQGN
jgi:CheY-like chemotaxis protein